MTLGEFTILFSLFLIVLQIAMLPGESFVRAIVSTWHTDFGITKIVFDTSMTMIAGILSLLFAHRLDGIREGTVIAAILVGLIAKLLDRRLAALPDILFPSSAGQSC